VGLTLTPARLESPARRRGGRGPPGPRVSINAAHDGRGGSDCADGLAVAARRRRLSLTGGVLWLTAMTVRGDVAAGHASSAALSSSDPSSTAGSP
jgi:hypothetical protein